MENKKANSPMWSMEFDEKGDLKDVSWSQAFLESLGIREGEEVPKDIDFWVSRIHPSDGLPEIRSLPATVLSRSDCDCE